MSKEDLTALKNHFVKSIKRGTDLKDSDCELSSYHKQRLDWVFLAL